MQQNNFADVIIIGGGQAGLSTSYLLKKNNINHIVFERGRIGESWLRRWDSFMLNSSNAFNLLPDESLDDHPDHFIPGTKFADRLKRYASANQLPVQTNSTVKSVDQAENGYGFSVTVERDGKSQTWNSNQIVIASGAHALPVIPKISKQIPQNIFQIHSESYRNPEQLPEGAVLIIGSATSGVQIAEELAERGRKVFLSTSSVARVPRRYRGKDSIDWMSRLGIFDKPTSQAEEHELHMKAPLMSGLGDLGHTISLQGLQNLGVTLLGYFKNNDGDTFNFENNLVDHIRFGDMFSAQVKGGIDQFIAMTGTEAPPPENDEADSPADVTAFENAPTSLDAKKENITSVIWTTGFTHDMHWINLPILDERGMPVHENGVSPFPKVYFMGLQWQRNLKSSLIYGTAEDAHEVVKAIAKKHYETMEVSA